jgi:hypothetical protein
MVNIANDRFKSVVEEIDLAEHPGLDLREISASSNKKLSFICRTCGKKWKARIDRRCLEGQGCSSCKAKARSKIEPASRR